MHTKKDAPGQTHPFNHLSQKLEALDLHAQAEEPQAEELFDIQAVGVPNRKRRGEISEAVFLGKACGLGFSVAKPWGDSEPYDFILNGGYGFLRVQVKSTARYAESRYRVKGGGWDDDCYTRDDIDFLVAYIVPENLWYVVPIGAFVSRKNLRFYPHSGRKARYEKYREAWCLMATPTAKPKQNKPAASPKRNQLARNKVARNKITRSKPARSKPPASCHAADLSVRCAICPLRK